MAAWLLLIYGAGHTGQRASRARISSSRHRDFCFAAVSRSPRRTHHLAYIVVPRRAAVPGGCVALVYRGAARESRLRQRVLLSTQPGTLQYRSLSAQAAVLVLRSGANRSVGAVAGVCTQRVRFVDPRVATEMWLSARSGSAGANA